MQALDIAFQHLIVVPLHLALCLWQWPGFDGSEKGKLPR
jgi:hypothetical protein